MKLTICIPLYNRGYDISKLLENLNSINNNVKNDIEIHVVISDYKSTDIDLEQQKTLYKDLNISVIYSDGTFDIVLSIIKGTEQVNDGLLLITDADTVFSDDFDLISLCKSVEKGVSFYNPICSTQSQPNGGWPNRYDEKRKVYVPLADHGGCGFILCYASDWKSLDGFSGYIKSANPSYLTGRGQKWGGHDDLMRDSLRRTIKIIRPITDQISTRPNNRTGEWYINDGSLHYL